MEKWNLTYSKKLPALKDPVLIEGLPGIGNVGKIAVDFLVDELKAKKLLTINSYFFPHSVFVNEKNLVELPSIDIYYKEGKKDILLLAGDIQPSEDYACYEFCDRIIEVCKKFNAKEIITLGGIGLNEIPSKPKIYVTGNSANSVKEFKKEKKVTTKLYGTIGPIIGVSGLLIGLSSKAKINSVCMLAETYGHPMYLGMKGAREILKILNKRLMLDISIDSLNKEISKIEKDIAKRGEDLFSLKKQTASEDQETENHYIG